MQHLRSLEIDSSDSIGEERSKKREYRFYLNRADGRYVFKVSTLCFIYGTEMVEQVGKILEVHSTLQAFI